jgi:crotonobetainyl-CoA:carnitine CoA-transferase CaiB-like acyl-CoA transferase
MVRGHLAPNTWPTWVQRSSKLKTAKMGAMWVAWWAPHFFGPGDSHFYQSFSRNKKSLTLDLKHPEGQAVLHQLARDADVVFNNLRGDLPPKLGLTYEQLGRIKPALVCAHLSAYGRKGSRANWPGYDYLMQAEAGYLSLTGEPDGPPSRAGLSIVDYMTGTTAALAMLAGVLSARQTGQGRDVDVSLYSVAMYNLAYLATWYLNKGVVTGRQARSGHPSLVPSELYRTQDGWMFVMCNKEKFWAVLCEKINRPQWISDERFGSFAARLKNRLELNAALDEVLQQQTTAHWLKVFAGQVPASAVNDVAQALDNEFAQEMGMVVNVDHPQGPIRTMACPITAGPVAAVAAPSLGQHTAQVLKEAGFTDQQIEKLRELAVI